MPRSFSARLLVLTGLLAVALAVTAQLHPAWPFLPPAGGRTWWVHPSPLAGHGNAARQQLRFLFTPSSPGELSILAMSRFQLSDGQRVLASGAGATGGSWKQAHRLQVDAVPLEVLAEDPRLLPALGLGGPAAPARVQVVRDGLETAALPAAELYRHRPALAPWLPRAGRLALLASIAIVLLIAIRPRRPDCPLAPPRPAIIGAALALHLLLLGWNVIHYPVQRGLDADGHLEYVRLIRERLEIPAPDAGWQTYHPPLYHLVSAGAVALSGSERATQLLSALAGFALLALVAGGLGARRWRGVVLVAALPVLLLSEPQATNEVWFAALATAALLVATGPRPVPAAAVLAGILAGLALLTRYTGVLFLMALVLAPLLAAGSGDVGPPLSRRRASALALLTLCAALAVGGWPYLDRLVRYGNPVIGNWDDTLLHPYRQPPGVRIASYFLRFGASLSAHPFEARNASLWDSLFLSTFGDGFGRFLRTPAQHHLDFALAWLALPIAAALLVGLFGTEAESRLDRTGRILIVSSLAALAAFNLALPFWSAAKGVFLLGLSLPAALVYERGRDALAARGGPWLGRLFDLDLVLFAVVSAVTFVYRG